MVQRKAEKTKKMKVSRKQQEAYAEISKREAEFSRGKKGGKK